MVKTTERRGREMHETVVERRRKPGRPVTVESGGAVPEVRRQLVRRTAWLDLDLDRALRQVIARDGRTYSSAMETALREYVEKVAV